MKMVDLFRERQYHWGKANLSDNFKESACDASVDHVTSFILSIMHQGKFSCTVLIMSMIYMWRFLQKTHTPYVHAAFWRPLWLVALLIADKVWQDMPVKNAALATLFPVLNTSDIQKLEEYFILTIEWDVNVKVEQFRHFASEQLLKLHYEAVAKNTQVYLNIQSKCKTSPFYQSLCTDEDTNRQRYDQDEMGYRQSQLNLSNRSPRTASNLTVMLELDSTAHIAAPSAVLNLQARSGAQISPARSNIGPLAAPQLQARPVRDNGIPQRHSHSVGSLQSSRQPLRASPANSSPQQLQSTRREQSPNASAGPRVAASSVPVGNSDQRLTGSGISAQVRATGTLQSSRLSNNVHTQSSPAQASPGARATEANFRTFPREDATLHKATVHESKSAEGTNGQAPLAMGSSQGLALGRSPDGSGHTTKSRLIPAHPAKVEVQQRASLRGSGAGGGSAGGGGGAGGVLGKPRNLSAPSTSQLQRGPQQRTQEGSDSRTAATNTATPPQTRVPTASSKLNAGSMNSGRVPEVPKARQPTGMRQTVPAARTSAQVGTPPSVKQPTPPASSSNRHDAHIVTQRGRSSSPAYSGMFHPGMPASARTHQARVVAPGQGFS
jgi:hypothetical protein